MRVNLLHAVCASVHRSVVCAAMTAALLSGCASAPASSRVDSGTPARAFSTSCLPHLPDPNVWRVNPTTLSRDEKTRKDEVCRHLADRYRREGWRIKVTIQMPSGDIIDSIDSSSVPGAQAQPLSLRDLLREPRNCARHTARLAHFAVDVDLDQDVERCAVG